MRNNGKFDPTHCLAGFFMNEETNSIWNVMWIFILVSFGDYHLKSKLWCDINGLCNFLETEVSLNRQVRQKIYFAVSYSELPSFTMVNGTGIIWPQLLSRPGYTRWFKYDRDWCHQIYTQIVPVIFEPPCITRLIPYHEGVLLTSHFSHCISTHWIQVWICLGAGIDAVKRKNSALAGNQTQANLSIVYLYTAWAIPTDTASFKYILLHTGIKTILLNFNDVGTKI